MGIPHNSLQLSKKWTQENLVFNHEIKKGIRYCGKEKLLNTKQHQKKCVYCEDTDHNSTYCKDRKYCWTKENTDEKKNYCSTALVSNIEH